MTAPRSYDVVFVGGGLSALLLLAALEGALPARVAVVDPSPPLEQPPVHWSYWSRRPTPYDRFAVGAWRRARVADAPPQPIAPYTMRLVRSTDVLAGLEARLEAAPVDRLRTTARSITHRSDGSYEVATDEAVLRAGWVFDSACGVAPVFRTRALLSGTGLRVEADRPVFDPAVATLFDPLDEESFAYALPLSPTEALVESASFGSTVRGGLDRGLLLRYLREGHPGASFAVAHEEYGEIPLGFAPRRTTGPRHVLLGTKRGLVKPSAGYGVVRIAEESERLAHLWRQRRRLPVSRRALSRWRLLDEGFLRLAAYDPGEPMTLLRRVMRAVPLVQSLSFIDEELQLRQLGPLMRAAYPVIFRRLQPPHRP